jgi:hypothetical protein
MPKITDVEQLERFKRMARELGCDEDKGRFEKQLGKIARHKPPPDAESRPKKSKTKPGR